MFKMRNAVGSAIIIAKNERRRDELLKRGFTLVEDNVNFDKMKGDKLEKFAADKGIDLSGCKNREEKLAKIKEAIGK